VGYIVVVTPESQTHVSLLARLTAGTDVAAWADFQSRYGDLIRGVCVRRGLQAADSDDVLQDVLIALTKAMPGFVYDPSRGRFRSYLRTVVSHAILKRVRQTGPVGGLSGVEGAGEEEDRVWEDEWRHHHFRVAMRAVGEEFGARDMAAFRMYALDGRSAEVVGTELGMSVDSVYQVKSRVLKRLAARIEEQVREEG
jgi:RNA polymerase sigma-70 factor (ECF subfamily)